MEKVKLGVAIGSILLLLWLSFYTSHSLFLVILVLSIWFQGYITPYFSDVLSTKIKKKRDLGERRSTQETRSLMSYFKTILSMYPVVMEDYSSFIRKIVKTIESKDLPSQDDLYIFSSELANISTELDVSLFGQVPDAYTLWKPVASQVQTILSILQHRVTISSVHSFKSGIGNLTSSYPSNSF